MKRLVPAIILSSHTIGLGVTRALGIMGVPIITVSYEKSDMGYLSKYVKKSIFAPHPEYESSNFLNFLIDLVKKNKGSILIPCDDTTLKIVSKYKGELSDFSIVAATDYHITEKYIFKKNTYELAEKNGIKIPITINLKTIDDLKKLNKNIEYPCILKPCESQNYFDKFKKKLVKILNYDQLIYEFETAASAGFEMILQEYIPGNDTFGVNYNSYFWNGEPLVEFTAQKIRLAPPKFGVPRVVMSKNIEEIYEPGRSILKSIGFYGYSCTEFKKDPRDGIYKLMEVNGRHNRSTLLSTKSGINFPWIQYKHLVLGEIPKKSEFKENIYWIDDLRDIIYTIKYFREEKYAIKDYVKPYFKKKIFSIFDTEDIKPFIKRIIYI